MDDVRGGKFDQRITLQSPQPVDADSFGAVNPGQQAWTTVRQTWAQISPVRGAERRESEKEIAELMVRFSIRYINAKDVQETWQIIHNSTGFIYDIRGIVHVNTDRRLIEFTCRRVL